MSGYFCRRRHELRDEFCWIGSLANTIHLSPTGDPKCPWAHLTKDGHRFADWKYAEAQNCFTMRRFALGNLSFGTVCERIAKESLLPSVSCFVHRNISRYAHCPTLDQVLSRKTRGRAPAKFLKFAEAVSRIRSGQESTGFEARVAANYSLVMLGPDPGIHP
jgi:hypothetical protein